MLKHSYLHKYDRNASAICRAAFKTSGATIAPSTILALLKGDGKITQAKLDALDGCLIIPPKTDMTYSTEELRAICRGVIAVRLTDFDRVNRFHDFMMGVICKRNMTLEDVAPQIDIPAPRLKRLMHLGGFGMEPTEIFKLTNWYEAGQRDVMEFAKLLQMA
ncbi:MAG: hypothetical protein F6K42_14910 [Leptolyngbya sp. SIO1D8]|nr:hypothetical protein [Leptolyngbya sp. SIO1D8]